jgi:SNF2 family DNA or RNA helicase
MGAAKVYNLLDQYGIALLADEVGMGKTIQALTVSAALWNQKPDARVLIFAPRDEIAQNWLKEYQTFIRHHYRNNDNLVKSITGQEPLKKMVYCQNMYQLVHQIQQGWGQLYLSKLSSFSSLMSRKDILSRLEELNIRETGRVRNLQHTRALALNEAVASLFKKEIQKHAPENQSYFDLLIIDSNTQI